jgi:hypothetical protein
MFNKVPLHADVWGVVDIAPRILNLGNKMEACVQIHTLATFSPWKKPRYSLDRRLVWLQNWSGRCGEDKNPPSPGLEPRSSIPQPSNYIDWAIARPRQV